MSDALEDTIVDGDKVLERNVNVQPTITHLENGHATFTPHPHRYITPQMSRAISFGTDTTTSMSVASNGSRTRDLIDDDRNEDNVCLYDFEECSSRMDRSVGSMTATNDEQEVIAASFSWWSSTSVQSNSKDN